MKIRLSEIPQEGRHYTFDRETGELNEALADILGESRYSAEMELKPIGNAYELRGRVRTSVPEVCSTCGYDFDLLIERKFHEILFEEHEEGRKAHSVHGNQSVDFLGEGVSMTPYRNEVFDAGEYVHEAIALSEPFYPKCGGEDTCQREAEVLEIRRRLEAEFASAEEVVAGHPAFAVLKSLAVDKKN